VGRSFGTLDTIPNIFLCYINPGFEEQMSIQRHVSELSF
jgi:hypothetical protein